MSFSILYATSENVTELELFSPVMQAVNSGSLVQDTSLEKVELKQ